MKLSTLKIAAVALVTAPLLLLTPSCAPECADKFDCADKAAAAGEPYTCDQGVCKPGNPTGPEPDGGEGGGGGEDDGGTGGGGGATGGGGGDDDGGTGGGGGATGGGGGDDGGTGGGGGATGGGGGATGGGGGATGGGGGTTPVDPVGSYAASLSEAQLVPRGTGGTTGTVDVTLTGLADGGYSLVYTVVSGLGTGGNPNDGAIERGLAGFASSGAIVTFASATTGTTGTQAVSPATAVEIAEGRTFARLTRGNTTIRGQLIPADHTLWTAQLNTSPASTARGGAQFVGPNDGGDLRYVGAWTGTVEATASHIHQGGAAGTGGVVVPLSLTADAGGIAGSFTVAALAAGNTDGGLYVNVHTTDAGDGLIRGQLVRH